MELENLVERLSSKDKTDTWDCDCLTLYIILRRSWLESVEAF
jgi:hypothetical protein